MPSRRARAAASAWLGSSRRTTTGEPSSRGSAPSGKAVVNERVTISSATIGVPCSSTSTVPRRHGAEERMSATLGPSEASGAITAAPTPTPAAPAAPLEQASARDAARARAKLAAGAALRGGLGELRPRLDGVLAHDNARRGEQQRRCERQQRSAERQREQLRVRARAHRSRRTRLPTIRRGRTAAQRGAPCGACAPARARRGRPATARHRPRASSAARLAARRSYGSPSDQARDQQQRPSAKHQATIPSGIGPMCPMPQPPRSTGAREAIT